MAGSNGREPEPDVKAYRLNLRLLIEGQIQVMGRLPLLMEELWAMGALFWATTVAKSPVVA